MSFLAPLFLLGALAVVGPILFHLIRRTTREVTPFSSLMFLRESPPRVTRRSRLENLWLLLLRCLVIGLLALGFARPFFPAKTTPLALAAGTDQALNSMRASGSALTTMSSPSTSASSSVISRATGGTAMPSSAARNCASTPAAPRSAGPSCGSP